MAFDARLRRLPRVSLGLSLAAALLLAGAACQSLDESDLLGALAAAPPPSDDEGGGGGGGGEGACTNDQDEAVIAAVGGNLFDPAIACWSESCDASCMATCVSQGYGVSESCARCFVDEVQCAVASCTDECQPDPQGAECTGCIYDSCWGEFCDCAGADLTDSCR